MSMLLHQFPVGAPRPSVVCQAQKKQKVNSRGKVSSRPGPESPRDIKKRAEEAKVASAAPASTATTAAPPSTPTAATPSAEPPAASTSSPAPTPVSQAPVSPPVQPRPASASTATTPQVVIDRIFFRMIACASVPLVIGAILLVAIAAWKKQGGDEVPLWPAYLSQGFTLMGGLLGISYGALSASWDPSRDGSTVGWTEFKTNVDILLNKDRQGNR